MSKRTIVVIVVVAAAIVGAVAVILILTYGGTPIIIKGFDDGGDNASVTIEGSPSTDTQAQTTAGKYHHTRLERIERLYVLDAKGSCVDYHFGNPSAPKMTIDVKGALEEIVLHHSLQSGSTNVLDLLFDDVNTYQKQTGGYYKRTQPGAIEKVMIDPGAGTTCTDQGGTPIKCPTEFSSATGYDLRKITIVANYKKSMRCTP